MMDPVLAPVFLDLVAAAMLVAVVHHLVDSPCQRWLRPGGRLEARAGLIRSGHRGPAAVQSSQL